MKLLLFLLRSIFVWIWILLGLIVELIVFPPISRRSRRKIVQKWSQGLIFLSGVKVKVVGEPVLDKAIFWVSNHVSWVDIFVLNSVRTTSFVAKSDIRRWPVLGLLVAWAGTLFIDRSQRYAIRDAAKQMQRCFAQGDVVGLFPEGTTTDGLQVKKFHTGLFDAAIQAKVAIQPVALRFMRGRRRAPELAFVGEQTLFGNLWHLLGAWGVSVECEFLPLVHIDETSNRAQVAKDTHDLISQSVTSAEVSEQQLVA